MINWWKSKTAKDRWIALRLSHWTYHGRPGVRLTKVDCRNKYSGKLKTFDLEGEYYPEDFPNNIYRK